MRLFPPLEYSPTQPFTLPHFTIIVYTLGLLWTIFITVLNVAAVGYESVPVFSNSFNSTTPLWYERIAPIGWLLPASWSCLPLLIEPGQGNGVYSVSNLICSDPNKPGAGLIHSCVLSGRATGRRFR